ncbi:hypothetical protein BT96DRAFT_952087, partial [Gymnopus androsaceus JB14]
MLDNNGLGQLSDFGSMPNGGDSMDEDCDPVLNGESDKNYMVLLRARMCDSEQKKSFRYGLPVNDLPILPLVSADNPIFHYSCTSLYQYPAPPCPPARATLEPNKIITPEPSPLCFPTALTYTLNPSIDYRFRRGYFYSAPINLDGESKAKEMERLYKIAMPPGVHPLGYDGESKTFTMAPVEGMIEMPAGIPFVACVDGDRDKAITVACVQTLDSLNGYPEHPRITQLFDEVFDLTWGTATTKPFFCLDGTKLNFRSQGEQEDCYDGSASHGITVEEQSHGFVQPAAQANSEEASIAQLKLLVRLAELYNLIVPLCVSKQEWEARKFRITDVNSLCCGGLYSGFSGVQKNVSSSFQGGSLAKRLGVATGAFHVDWKDDPAGWTLIIALFRLPPGSAVGDFLLARSGLYLRVHTDENGYAHFFALIKGNDLHSGTSPTACEAEIKPFFDSLRGMFLYVGPENRVVYVLYPNLSAFQRTEGVSMTQYTSFEPRIPGRQPNPHNFSDDGFPACGTFDDWQ